MLDSLPNTIVVAFHGEFSIPFNEYQGDSVAHSFPFGIDIAIPDGLGYGVDYLHIMDTVKNLYKKHPETPIALEISSKLWDPDRRVVDLTLSMRNDGPDLSGSYWFNVIVTEDNIKEHHKTCTGCSTPDYPAQPYIDSDYINSWVTRKMVFWSQGKSLVKDTWWEGVAFTESCSIFIEPEWISQNCYIVVSVYEKADSLYNSPVMQAIREPVIGWTDISESGISRDGTIGIFPNPFSTSTTIEYELKQPEKVTLKVYDYLGKQVFQTEDNQSQGKQQLIWNAESFADGIYYYSLQIGEKVANGKMVKVK